VKIGELWLNCISFPKPNSFGLFVLCSLLVIHSIGSIAFAAVGCTLTDPDRDILRLFPKSTGYKTEFISIDERGGDLLKALVENKLGDKLDTVYETNDVPYAYYKVLSGKEVIGYVHGVNQKGMYGGLQLILATDTNGIILDFYYQRISSPESNVFRSSAFTGKFKGMSLKDFYDSIHSNTGKLTKVANPSKDSKEDFDATLRGLAKNLILFDQFLLSNKYDSYFTEVKK
jgi:hypothetical protein